MIHFNETYHEINEDFMIIIEEIHNTETLRTFWEGSVEIFGTDVFKWEKSEESLQDCIDKLMKHV